MHEPAVSP